MDWVEYCRFGIGYRRDWHVAMSYRPDSTDIRWELFDGDGNAVASGLGINDDSARSLAARVYVGMTGDVEELL